MLRRLFADFNSFAHMLTLNNRHHYSLFACTLALGLWFIAPVSYGYTLEGPRYSSAPTPTPKAEQVAEPQQAQAPKKPQKELSAEELAAIKEQNEFMAQIQNSIAPNPALENKEIEQIVAAGDLPLLIYGSTQLDKFLGCLNCNPKYSISVWNAKGPYGSSRGDFSIWNTLFEFGNVKSRVCPWNQFASNPPAVIDPKGTFYGFLTSNSAINSHFTNNFTLTLLLDYQDIALSPQKWFEDTFAQQLANNPNTVALKYLEALPKPLPKDQRLLPTKSAAPQVAPVVERRQFSPFDPPKQEQYHYQLEENNKPFKFP